MSTPAWKLLCVVEEEKQLRGAVNEKWWFALEEKKKWLKQQEP